LNEELKKEFIEVNDNKKYENSLKRSKDIEIKSKERFYYFPFTYGDEIEKYREGLGHQLK
jgi:hypothetical protein